jgi:peptide chain release factor 3
MNHFDPVARRKSFVIVSHPDAGKATPTEKVLPFGGGIQLADGARQV